MSTLKRIVDAAKSYHSQHNKRPDTVWLDYQDEMDLAFELVQLDSCPEKVLFHGIRGLPSSSDPLVKSGGKVLGLHIITGAERFRVGAQEEVKATHVEATL